MATITGYAINNTQLPTPQFAQVPQPQSDRLLAKTRILLHFDSISIDVADLLMQFRFEQQATLHLQLANANWVTNIPVRAYAYGDRHIRYMGGNPLGVMPYGVNKPINSRPFVNANVYLVMTVLEPTLLTTPKTTAMLY